MDSKHKSRRNQGIASAAQLAKWRQLSFAEIEKLFLKLLGSDIPQARQLFRFLQKTPLSLSPLEEARQDRLFGRYFLMTSKHVKALEYTSKAKASFQAQNDRTGVYQCYLTMYGIHYIAGRLDKARDNLNEAFKVANGEGDRLKLFSNLGAIDLRMHHYKEALAHFNSARELLPFEPKHTCLIYFNIAIAQVGLNQFGEAECSLEKALVCKRKDHILIRAAIYKVFGRIHSILGQHYLAEDYFSKARDVYLQVGDREGAAVGELELFTLKLHLNQWDQWLKDVDKLFDELKDLGLSYESGLLCHHAANAAIGKEDYALAEEYLDEAISYFESVKNDHYLALCSMLQGILYWKEEAVDDAKSLIQSALKTFVTKKLHELELECRICLAGIDNDTIADKDYRRIRHLISRPISHRIRVQALLLISDYWYAKGKLSKAIEFRFEAVMSIEESRASIPTDELRQSFFVDKIDAYDHLVEWLFEWNNKKAQKLIFKVLSLSRSRQYSERLSELEELPPVINRSEPTLFEMNKLQDRLAQLDRRLKEVQADPSFTDVEKAAAVEEYENTLKALGKIKLNLADDTRLGMYFPVEITQNNIQEHLPEKTLVVSYFLGKRHFYRVELDRNGLETFKIPLYKSFGNDLKILYGILSNRMFAQIERTATILKHLEAWMVPRRLKDNQKLVFVPHKRLQTFPFALLSKDGRYLIEDYEMCSCPNLTTLYFSLKKEASKLKKPLFMFSDHVNDPTAPERHHLMKLFPKAKVNNAISRSRRDMLASDFIHFAGHCFVNKKSPDKSHLLLGEEKLYLKELSGKRLTHPFISLASCHSGYTVVQAGNEPYGFVTSFFAMGASNILATLWDIDDEATGEWMDTFYENIHKGKTYAYREACLALMKTRKEPYFWAGFCLLGKP